MPTSLGSRLGQWCCPVGETRFEAVCAQVKWTHPTAPERTLLSARPRGGFCVRICAQGTSPASPSSWPCWELLEGMGPPLGQGPGAHSWKGAD